MGFWNFFGFGSEKPKALTSGDWTRDMGSSGVQVYAGQVYGEESNAELSGGKFIPLVKKMYRSDSSVSASYRLSVAPIRLANYRFEWPRGAEIRQDVQLYMDRFWDMGDKTWDETLAQACKYLLYGHMPMEITYRAFGDQLWLKHLAPRMPHEMARFETDDNGNLAAYHQQAMVNGEWRAVRIPAEKLLFLVNDGDDGNFEGISLARPAYRHYQMKLEELNIDRTRIRRFGSAIPKFTEPPDEGSKNKIQREANRAAIDDIAYKLRSGSYANVILPNGWGLEFENPDESGSSILSSVQYHDAQIYLSFCAMVLGIGSSSVAQGLGSTLETVAALGPAAAAQYIVAEFNKKVFWPLLEKNFGQLEQKPYFKVSNVMGLKLSDVLPYYVQGLQAGGLTHTYETEAFLRETFDLPEIRREEYEEGQAKKSGEAVGRQSGRLRDLFKSPQRQAANAKAETAEE